jgi:hypothetical protein
MSRRWPGPWRCTAVAWRRAKPSWHQDSQLMSSVKQHIEGAVRELQQFDRWIDLFPVQVRSDIGDYVPQ